MRRFHLAWGAFMYAFLVVIGAIGLQALAQIGVEQGVRSLVFIAVALIVAAASLLTRMLVGTSSELQSVESQLKTD